MCNANQFLINVNQNANFVWNDSSDARDFNNCHVIQLRICCHDRFEIFVYVYNSH